MSRVLLDTNIFVYATGKESRYRAPCREIVGALGDGRIEGEACVDLLQELVHQRYRQTRDRRASTVLGRHVAELIRLHVVGPEDLPLAFTLYEDHADLDLRDATFAAVALRVGVSTILSADRAFDLVPGLTRVDPLDRAAIGELLRGSD